jgi:hypothetical protein
LDYGKKSKLEFAIYPAPQVESSKEEESHTSPHACNPSGFNSCGRAIQLYLDHALYIGAYGLRVHG